MAAYIKVFRKLQDAISATNFLTIYFKPKQIQVFESILNLFDVIAVLPTGYGKCCLFQLLPGFLQQSNEKGIVIVLSPLNSIIIDQLNTLKKLDIKDDILKDPFNNERQTSRMYQMMLKTVVRKYSLATQKHYLVITVEVYLNVKYTKNGCCCGY